MGRVLVVEDDEAAIEAARKALTHAGDHVEVARTFVEAEAALAAGPYDRIFLDVHFPYSDDELLGSVGREVMGILYGDDVLFERLHSHLMTQLDNSDVANYDRPAPLGLRLVGAVAKAGTPFMLTPQGSRHGGSKGYIRYFMEDALGNDVFVRLLARRGSREFDKTQPEEWARMNNVVLGEQKVIYGWIEAAKTHPLVSPLIGY